MRRIVKSQEPLLLQTDSIEEEVEVEVDVEDISFTAEQERILMTIENVLGVYLIKLYYYCYCY